MKNEHEHHEHHEHHENHKHHEHFIHHEQSEQSEHPQHLHENLKKVMVDPERSVPYWIKDWSARSSAFSIKKTIVLMILMLMMSLMILMMLMVMLLMMLMITYWRCHPLHREEGREVGRVGGDDDQGEEPPDSPNYSCGGGLKVLS